VNTSEPLLGLLQARQRVLEIQTKLHRWANDDPHRRFDDLFNLVTDPSFLLMAWERVEGNKGARSAGVDGRTAASFENASGWKISSPSCGISCGPAVSVRCRCGNG